MNNEPALGPGRHRNCVMKVMVNCEERAAFRKLARFKKEAFAAMVRQLCWREIRDWDLDVEDVCPNVSPPRPPPDELDDLVEDKD